MAIGSPRDLMRRGRATRPLPFFPRRSGLDFAAVHRSERRCPAMDTSKVISTLNGLIETCKDREQGFKTAAEGLNDTQVKTMFQLYSRQRGEMARELQNEVQK